MNHQLEMGYLVLQVPEPDSLDTVFADVVGLAQGEPAAPGTRTWRNDQRSQRLIVEPGPANDAVAVGVEAIDTEAFDTTVARLQAAGFAMVEDSGHAAGAPGRTSGPHRGAMGDRRRNRPRARRRIDSVLVGARPGRLPDRGRGLRPRRARDDGLR